MRKMYSNEQKVISYDKEKYKTILEEISGVLFDDIFNDLIYGTADFTPYLELAMEGFGWSMNQINPIFSSHNYGLKVSNSNGFSKVIGVLDGGAADLSGIVLDDVIHSVNGFRLTNNFENWLNYFSETKIVISLERDGELRRLALEKPTNNRYYDYEIK